MVEIRSANQQPQLLSIQGTPEPAQHSPEPDIMFIALLWSPVIYLAIALIFFVYRIKTRPKTRKLRLFIALISPFVLAVGGLTAAFFIGMSNYQF